LARGFFGFFLVSGFCSLVYEVVWLRLAMAQFGVTTPMVSIVLSVFMGGLALGSWAAGRAARRLESRPALVVRLYAAAELLIACSAEAVPRALAWGRGLLQQSGAGAWGSAGYYAASGLWVAGVLLPFCVCMGATFPLAMGALRRLAPGEASRSFSYLYLANVVGAAAGTLGSAFVLVEALGFRNTLRLTALLNLLLAACALLLSIKAAGGQDVEEPHTFNRDDEPADGLAGPRILWALFSTGLVSMAVEVVWVRQFTPYLGNVVYTFALILALYLLATASCSLLYRRRARRGAPALGALVWSAMALACVWSLAAADPRWGAGGSLRQGLARAAIGIVPFCGLLGFTTPALVDRWSRGDPQRAGLAYAVNVIGCIFGPLVAGFGLLPLMAEPTAQLLLAAPLLGLGLAAAAPPAGSSRATPRGVVAGAAALCLALALAVRTYESRFEGALVRRDSTATVTAWGQRMKRQLLVNGVGMTHLTPITKLMVHLPLALSPRTPRNALIICFGMGTSFRSALSWDLDTTAVELIPSVPSLFGYFHPDAPRQLRSPRAHLVIDDGRRFLERSPDAYDLIAVDPPPPVEAAGSSLLYSREFYETAKARLRPGGILQQWIPGGERSVVASFAAAIREAFPEVRAFVSLEGWGVHLLASDRVIPAASAAELARRLPPAAVLDLLEWGPASSAQEQLDLVLQREFPVEQLSAAVPEATALHDDRPLNEYYVLRRLRRYWKRQ
jgi:spermidine synthase